MKEDIMDDVLRSLGLLPKRKPRPKAAPAPPPELPQSVPAEEDVFETRPGSLFTMADFRRLDPGGTGSLADRHKKLFPGVGSVSDREKKYLVSKGAVTGSLQDRWRKILSTPPGVRIGESIRKLAALP
jgi:hypothetical protein